MIRSVHLVSADERRRSATRNILDANVALDVVEHPTPQQFLASIAALPPGVVLLDGRPADGMAREVLAALSERQDRLITIVVTEQADTRHAVEAMKAGAHDLLELPVADEQLLEAITAARDALEQRWTRRRILEAAQARIASLTPRERDVLVELVAGSSNKAIAQRLDLSPRTVEIHRSRLMAKLGARCLSQALRIAFDAGL